MAAPVAVDPAIVIPTVGVEAVGSERGGTVRPPGVGSPVPGSRESSRAFDSGPTRSGGSRDVRTPGDSVAARSDGRAGTTDIRVGAAARRGALNPIGSAPRYAAAGASGGLSRRAVVDRPSPRRIVGTRARAVIDLASAHTLGGSSTSVAHARAVAPVRAARAKRGRPAERFHPAIASPEAATIASPEAAAITTATAEAAAAAKTTTTAEAVERRDRPSGEQNRQEGDERDK